MDFLRTLPCETAKFPDKDKKMPPILKRRHDCEQIGGKANGRSIVVDPWELQLLSEGLNVFGFEWD